MIQVCPSCLQLHDEPSSVGLCPSCDKRVEERGTGKILDELFRKVENDGY